MEVKLYIIILVYFLIGGGIMAVINRNKTPEVSKNNWVKYFVYLLIVNILFITITFRPGLFRYICLVIIAFGFYELGSLSFKLKKGKIGWLSLGIFLLISVIFYHFSLMPKRYLFYTVFQVTVFDAFCQLSGQLFGRRKLIPKISPNKTYEGLLGGLVLAVVTSILIRQLLLLTVWKALLLGLGVSFFALFGDLLASYCKRKFGTKDFSALIPGHGGFLDRFDSMLIAGPFMLFMEKYFEI